MKSSSFDACKEAPSKTIIATSSTPFALMAQIMKIKLRLIKGDAVFIFVMYAHCFCPFAHAWALIVSPLFSVKKIKDSMVVLFSSTVI